VSGSDAKQIVCFDAETLGWGSVAYHRVFARFAVQVNTLIRIWVLFTFDKTVGSNKARGPLRSLILVYGPRKVNLSGGVRLEGEVEPRYIVRSSNYQDLAEAKTE
jgi:hypothetical protein